MLTPFKTFIGVIRIKTGYISKYGFIGIILLVATLLLSGCLQWDDNTCTDNTCTDSTLCDSCATQEFSKIGIKGTLGVVIDNDCLYTRFYTYIYDELANMPLEEKVGQLFFVNITNEDYDVCDIKPGGIILFSDSFSGKSPTEVYDMIDTYNQKSTIDLLVGVDEEGGSVVRVSDKTQLASKRFLSPRDLYDIGGLSVIKADTVCKSRLLLSYGINVNLAPVADLSNDEDDFIYNRSLSDDPILVSAYVDTVIREMNRQKIGSVLKHFPGYGDNEDTHIGVVVDNREYNSFVENDLIPFGSGIESGVDSVLVSHNIVTSIDNEYPASLSKNVHDILRQDLNFTGVIITDDLGMDAIDEYSDEGNVAVVALEAGNDMVLTSDYKKQYKEVLQAVKTGRIKEERIDQSLIRILMWKYKIGLLDI